MQVRPIGKILIGDGRTVGYFSHPYSDKIITVLDPDWITYIHLAYPGYKLVMPEPKPPKHPPSDQDPYS